MTITIRELLNNPHLKSSVIAGNDGLDREVTWAHACELSDPTHWLTGGELIMTNGFAIPSSEEEQIVYLQKLIDSNASGLAIGKGLHAPKLSDGFKSLADQKAFPILNTDYDVPWIAFSKTVANAYVNQEHAQVILTMRLYDKLRKTINHDSPNQILRRLNEIIGCKLYIIDAKNKWILFEQEKDLNIEELAYIKSNELPYYIKHIKTKDKLIAQVSIPSSRPTILLVISNAGSLPDNVVLRHLATIIGIIVEKDMTILEKQRRIGAELLIRMVEGNVTDEAASILLNDHGLGKKTLQIVACSGREEKFNYEWLHYWLHDTGIPNLITLHQGILLILLPEKCNILSKLQTESPNQTRIGVSDSINRLNRTSKAYQEAIWALQSAETHGRKVVFYSESFPVSPFIPRDRTDAEMLMKDVLGDLLDYDRQNNSELVKTLYVYLYYNRSWKASAKSLNIHKQTLVYRVNRIEVITGYRLNNISHISELWMALQTALMLKMIPDFAEAITM
ncbi:PucR family transcriptional regulator [Siminovitchia acidinfaciens]|uniref:PucR family transcriptional regulator n=1 Tax=Siminovitchia acidinfaciens TaxID=2321395 RepID=A0A429Y783_9BACI|nr:PucR family transcriptional regulator [Siminovitchia acidinfaciens]RST77265.1 PucR family transcriptional regulator [Siminovitchia acidinfaciens]